MELNAFRYGVGVKMNAQRVVLSFYCICMKKTMRSAELGAKGDQS